MPDALPETMTVIEISEPGGPDVLVRAERPVPSPGPGEVLIRVSAAGINRPDLLQRMGLYPPPEGASDIPGLEVAGQIVAVGEGVGDRKVGRMVCALIAGGGYAGYAVAPLATCLPIPAGLSEVEAAALPETVFTVYTNVVEAGALQEGERLLVHGGTSGIGTMAIQMATATGAEVFVTCGTPEKCDAARQIGAAQAFNYKTDSWAEQVTGLGGVDVVLDMVGGEYVARNVDCLRPGGRHVSIAFQKGAMAEISIVQIMRKQLVLTGSTLRARPVAEKARLAEAVREHIWPLVEAGKIRPVMDQTFPMADAGKAHARMEAGAHIGKIVLAG